MKYSIFVRGVAAAMWDSAASMRSSTRAAHLWRSWRIARYVLVVPALVELTLILRMIWTGTTNVPWWDEWRTVEVVRAFNTGTLSVQDLVAFHNEHRIILPRLLDLLLIVPTHWNRQVEMTFDLLVAVATYALLCLVVYRTVRSRQVAFVVCALGAALAFTLGAATDWLAPFQIQFILTVSGVVICVWALAVEHITWRRVALAALGALGATLSGSSGLMAWPAFVPVIWRGGWRQRAAWLALGLVSWRLYFASLPATGLGSHHSGAYQPLAVIGFALAYLGAPMGYPSFAVAIAAGSVSMVLICAHVVLYWWMRRDLRPVLPWLGLAFFVLGCAALTDYGRVTRSVLESLLTRHQLFSALWWIVLLVLVGLNVERLISAQGSCASDRQSRRHISQRLVVGASVLALTVLTISFLNAERVAWGEAIAWQAEQQRNQQCVVHYATASDTCLKTYFWNPREVRKYAQYLQQAQIGIFYSPGASSAALHAGRR